MIKCSRCGAELSEDTKFCSYCGNKIEVTTPPPIKEDTISSGTFQTEQTKPNVKKSDAPKSVVDKIKEKASAKWHDMSTYGKIATVAISIFVLLCLVAFIFGKTAAGIIAILQILLTVVAVLIKKEIIKVPKTWIHFAALALAVVLIVPYVSLFSVDYGDAEKFAWSDILLADVVPEPESHFGEIIGNSDECLSLYVYRTSVEDYSEYVEACKEKGFTVEAEQSEQSYYAYNADGYKLSLYYDENDNKMNIGVDAAKQYGTLVWPDSTIASMLPVPKSTTGEITQDDENGFAACVSDTPIEEFNAYVAACADKGFTVDAHESDKSYSAENSDGYQLSVSYQGNSVISISVDVPEYAVSIEIECVENWIFSKYDVKVYVDDSIQGTINHGTTETYELSLTKGVHEVKFVSADDHDVMGTTTIDIYQDESLKYKISCTSTEINVEVIKGTVSEHTENIKEPQETNKKIIMPHSASDYIGSDWTIETITKHFEELGFTNIQAVPCEPDDDNYETNIRELVISKGLFSTDPWEAGEKFDADAEISIYYNEFPILTINNCADLATVLTSKNMDYMTFCKKYDGRYVEFDAYVIEHITYDGGTSHIIDVAGGDYDGESEIDAYNPETYAGLNVRIGDRTWGNSINENVQVGDNVTVSGRIDASWAEYYKCLYIETMHLYKR